MAFLAAAGAAFVVQTSNGILHYFPQSRMMSCIRQFNMLQSGAVFPLDDADTSPTIDFKLVFAGLGDEHYNTWSLKVNPIWNVAAILDTISGILLGGSAGVLQSVSHAEMGQKLNEEKSLTELRIMDGSIITIVLQVSGRLVV